MARTYALALILCSAALGCSKSEPAAPAAKANDALPDWKAAISHEVRFDAAAKAVVVDVKVQPGFHAYTTGETTGKPLKLTIAEDSEYALEGEVEYPKGVTKDLPVGRSVIVEGAAQVKATVKAKAEGAKTVRGGFRYQVCTDEACDRPRTKKFELPAT